MFATISITNLHLRYRLWIAEMNFDINVLRIFSDHLQQAISQRKTTDIKEAMTSFEKKFADLRREIDELKNEMHLTKMQLASYSRENQHSTGDAYTSDAHTTLAERYRSYRENFELVKKEVDQF